MPGNEVIGPEERKEILDIFENGSVLFRHGFDNMRGNCYKVAEFEKNFAKKFNLHHSLALTSGTAALRVALAAVGIGAGDEVITSAFTFVATVEAIIESRATPRCAEIDETLNMDPQSIEQLVTENTKALIVVHMLGVPCDMLAIRKICEKHDLILIEDTAWGCGATLNEVPLGTFGEIGVFSFDYAKTITTGEGGMLITNNKKIYEKAAAWHDHGHENNPQVPRWKDTRSSSGFNFRMTEMQGAIGVAQLKKLDKIIEKQTEHYDKLCKVIGRFRGLSIRPAPTGSKPSCDAFIFYTPSSEAALECRQALIKNGVSTKILPEAITWHFAEHWDHMPELVNAHNGVLSFNRSRKLLERCVSLPISVHANDLDVDRVEKSLQKVNF